MADAADGAVHDVDLAIVGAGPAGLFAAYYAGFRGLRAVLVDALPEPGGQISALYPEKQIFDVAGFPAVTGRELVDRLTSQADRFGPGYVFGEQAAELEPTDQALVLRTSTGRRIRSRAVIIAAGIGHFTPRSLPPVRGVTGDDIAYFVPDPGVYAGRDVVVVGGGDSAFDWATTLAPAAASVTLVHRRAAFRAHAASVAEAERLGVRILTDATPVLGRRDQGLSTLEVAVRGRSASVVVPCQQIVAALGFTARLGPVLDWGLDVRDHRHVPVGTDMRTAVPGVYAAGDIATYPGKVPLIAVGFAEAATAVNNACVWIDPTAEVVPGHSTEQSILTGTRS